VPAVPSAAAAAAAAAASVVRDPVGDDAGIPEGAVGLGAGAAPAAVLACLCTADVAEELLAANGPAPAAAPSAPALASAGVVTMRIWSPSAAAVVTAMGAMPPWCFSTSTLMCFKAPGKSSHIAKRSIVSAYALHRVGGPLGQPCCLSALLPCQSLLHMPDGLK